MVIMMVNTGFNDFSHGFSPFHRSWAAERCPGCFFLRAKSSEWFDHSDSCGPQISNNISQDSSESEDFIVLLRFFCPKNLDD